MDAVDKLADPEGAGGAAAQHNGARGSAGKGNDGRDPKGFKDPITAVAAALGEWTKPADGTGPGAAPDKDGAQSAIPSEDPDPGYEDDAFGGAAFIRPARPSLAPPSNSADKVAPAGGAAHEPPAEEPARDAPGLLDPPGGTTATGDARPRHEEGASAGQEKGSAERGRGEGEPEGPSGEAVAEPRSGDFYTDEVAMDVGGADGTPAADADDEQSFSKGAAAIAQARLPGEPVMTYCAVLSKMRVCCWGLGERAFASSLAAAVTEDEQCCSKSATAITQARSSAGYLQSPFWITEAMRATHQRHSAALLHLFCVIA